MDRFILYTSVHSCWLALAHVCRAGLIRLVLLFSYAGIIPFEITKHMFYKNGPMDRFIACTSLHVCWLAPTHVCRAGAYSIGVTLFLWWDSPTWNHKTYFKQKQATGPFYRLYLCAYLLACAHSCLPCGAYSIGVTLFLCRDSPTWNRQTHFEQKRSNGPFYPLHLWHSCCLAPPRVCHAGLIRLVLLFSYAGIVPLEIAKHILNKNGPMDRLSFAPLT